MESDLLATLGGLGKKESYAKRIINRKNKEVSNP